LRAVLVEARALRRLGRVVEAEAMVQRGLDDEPRDGPLRAVAASLALDRGDAPHARELIRDALAHSPGDTFTLVAQVELALATESRESAQAALARIEAAVAANPHAWLDGDVARLRARIALLEA